MCLCGNGLLEFSKCLSTHVRVTERTPLNAPCHLLASLQHGDAGCAGWTRGLTDGTSCSGSHGSKAGRPALRIPGSLQQASAGCLSHGPRNPSSPTERLLCLKARHTESLSAETGPERQWVSPGSTPPSFTAVLDHLFLKPCHGPGCHSLPHSLVRSSDAPGVPLCASPRLSLGTQRWIRQSPTLEPLEGERLGTDEHGALNAAANVEARMPRAAPSCLGGCGAAEKASWRRRAPSSRALKNQGKAPVKLKKDRRSSRQRDAGGAERRDE